MKLQNTFSTDTHNFSLVKRGKKAAIYRRETSVGAFVSFDVFALLTDKTGTEIYPQSHALSKWAWSPSNEDRAKTYFDRIEKGEMTVANYNPLTSEVERPENEPSLEEVMAGPDVVLTEAPSVPTVNVSEVVVSGTEQSVETINVTADVVPDPIVEDPTAVDVAPTPEPTVESADEDPIAPEVSETADGSAVVTVAKVRKARVKVAMNIPALAEFTQAQFAEANGLPARGVVYGRIQAEIEAGRVVLKEMRHVGKGRPTSIYAAVIPQTV
jgi:hypothetical protein